MTSITTPVEIKITSASKSKDLMPMGPEPKTLGANESNLRADFQGIVNGKVMFTTSRSWVCQDTDEPYATAMDNLADEFGL